LSLETFFAVILAGGDLACAAKTELPSDPELLLEDRHPHGEIYRLFRHRKAETGARSHSPRRAGAGPVLTRLRAVVPTVVSIVIIAVIALFAWVHDPVTTGLESAIDGAAIHGRHIAVVADLHALLDVAIAAERANTVDTIVGFVVVAVVTFLAHGANLVSAPGGGAVEITAVAADVIPVITLLGITLVVDRGDPVSTARASAIAVAGVAVDVVPVIAFLSHGGDAVTAGGKRAIGVAAITFVGVAVIAGFVAFDDAVTTIGLAGHAYVPADGCIAVWTTVALPAAVVTATIPTEDLVAVLETFLLLVRQATRFPLGRVAILAALFTLAARCVTRPISTGGLLAFRGHASLRLGAPDRQEL